MGEGPSEQESSPAPSDDVDLDRDYVSAEEATALLGLTRLELFRRLRLDQVGDLRHLGDGGWYVPRSALPGLAAGSWWAGYGPPHGASAGDAPEDGG